MVLPLAARPLLRWDAFTLTVDLDMLELLANRELARRQLPLRRAALGGAGEELELVVEGAWQGLPAHVSVRVSELRLHRRVFGCRVESLRGPLGIPLPLSLAATIVRRASAGMARLDAEDRVLLVDVRRFLPEGLEVRVRGVRCEGRWLHVRLDGGSVAAALAGTAAAGD
jgi:hypothetical protein